MVLGNGHVFYKLLIVIISQFFYHIFCGHMSYNIQTNKSFLFLINLQEPGFGWF